MSTDKCGSVSVVGFYILHLKWQIEYLHFRLIFLTESQMSKQESNQRLAIDAGYILSIFSNLRWIEIFFYYDPVYMCLSNKTCDMNWQTTIFK